MRQAFPSVEKFFFKSLQLIADVRMVYCCMKTDLVILVRIRVEED